MYTSPWRSFNQQETARHGSTSQQCKRIVNASRCLPRPVSVGFVWFWVGLKWWHFGRAAEMQGGWCCIVRAHEIVSLWRLALHLTASSKLEAAGAWIWAARHTGSGSLGGVWGWGWGPKREGMRLGALAVSWGQAWWGSLQGSWRQVENWAACAPGRWLEEFKPTLNRILCWGCERIAATRLWASP